MTNLPRKFEDVNCQNFEVFRGNCVTVCKQAWRRTRTRKSISFTEWSPSGNVGQPTVMWPISPSDNCIRNGNKLSLLKTTYWLNHMLEERLGQCWKANGIGLFAVSFQASFKVPVAQCICQCSKDSKHNAANAPTFVRLAFLLRCFSILKPHRMRQMRTTAADVPVARCVSRRSRMRNLHIHSLEMTAKLQTVFVLWLLASNTSNCSGYYCKQS